MSNREAYIVVVALNFPKAIPIAILTLGKGELNQPHRDRLESAPVDLSRSRKLDDLISSVAQLSGSTESPAVAASAVAVGASAAVAVDTGGEGAFVVVAVVVVVVVAAACVADGRDAGEGADRLNAVTGEDTVQRNWDDSGAREVCFPIDYAQSAPHSIDGVRATYETRRDQLLPLR